MKKNIFLLIIPFFFIGCGQFYRLMPQYNLPEQSLKTPHQQGNTRVFFYNTSNLLLFGSDFTDKIDILLDNKNVGSIRRNEYILIDVKPKEYELNLSHHDLLMKFSNTYNLKVSGKNMFIKIYNGLMSTKYKLEEQFPNNFEKRFKPIYKKILEKNNRIMD